MEIVTAKSIPSAPEVAAILKQEFSGHHSYEVLPEEESIVVRKSTWVTAQITIHENEMIIQAVSQSLLEVIIVQLCMSELGLFLIPLFYYKGTQLLSQRSEFEQELSYFLARKYNHEHVRVEQA
jgi:hypothetical protein